MRQYMLLATLVLSVSLALAAPRTVLVMEAGRSSTAIVLAAQATSCAQYAALELQYHLEKITGEKPPMVREPAPISAPVKIAVGNTALGRSLGFAVGKLAPWEFLVAERGGTIVLAGGDQPGTAEATFNNLGPVWNSRPNGTCRAVYEFLEEFCGVHWYLPSEAGMVYPQTRKLTVRLDAPVRRRSDFRSTSFYPYQVNANMYCPPHTPELTGEDAPASDMEKWRRHLWTIPVTTQDMLPVLEVQRWLLRNKVGGESYGPNHSFGHWLEKYGPAHPEWFNYKNRERIQEILARGAKPAYNEWHTSGEPCLTTPGVFEQVVQEAREYLDTGKYGRFFSVVPNDNYVWCQCPTCKPLYDQPTVDAPVWGGATGRASSYLWEFANRVAREIRRTHPEGWVGGIAYHDYMVPPQDFALEPNVAVTICTYLGNWTPALRDTAAGLVKAWRDDAKCQWIGLWEYFCYCAMAQYQPMFPKVCPRLLGEDVKRMYQLGVRAEFIETEEIYRFADAPDRGWAIWSNPIWLYLNVWTRFKLWDDTTRDVSRLLEDHYRLFYGPAARPIQRFFDRVEARITDMSLRGPKTFNDLSASRQMADWEYLFPPPVMKELRATMDQAVALATAEPFKTRVRWVNEGFLAPQEQAAARYHQQMTRTPAQQPRQGICERVAGAPAVDGVAEEVWSKLPAYFLGDWRNGARPKSATWFKLAHDKDRLYLLARCQDAQVSQLRAHSANHDEAVYSDDCVELHLTFDRTRSQRYQILVNSRGVTQDLRYTLNEAGVDVADSAWNCPGLQAAGRVDDQGYTVELSLPLASVGGVSQAGTLWYANVAREKYSGGHDGVASELQAWSATQGAFAEGRYFSRLVMSGGDGYRLSFAEPTPPPAPVLYQVDSQHPWTVAPEAIQAVTEQDRGRYLMKCPQVEEKGRTYGGFGVKLDPPVAVADHPFLELVCRKPSRDLLLEVIYTYVGADGKDATNYFIVSGFGEANPAAQVFARSLLEGHETGKSAPRLIKSLTIYGVVEGVKTPLECSFEVESLRLCRETLEGLKP